MNDDELRRAEEQKRKLAELEEKYSQQIQRIKEESEQNDAERAERDYKIQLSKAKTAVQYEKVKQDRIFDLREDANNKSLEQLKDSLNAEIAERDTQFRNLKYQRDSGLISEQQYYSDLARLRDIYFEEGSREWQEYSVEIAQYEYKTLEECKNNIISIIRDTADAVTENRAKVESNLEDYTNLFNTIKIKYKKMGPYGSDMIITKTELDDLQKQNEVLFEYRDALAALKERSVPTELFDALKELDVDEGLRFAKALLDASEKEFEVYIEGFKAQRDAIKEIAADLTSDETDKAIAVMKEKLAEVYGEIPDEFWKCGTESAANFGEAFAAELENVFSKISGMAAESAGELMPAFTSSLGTQNVSSYTASYNFYGSGESVSSQLRSARAAAVAERMRGGYDV